MADQERPDVCPKCKAEDKYDLEDMPDGSLKYVCTECGHLHDEVVLVTYGNFTEDGREEQYGTHVAADDDGTRAGAAWHMLWQ
jgi:rubredoxin